MSISQFIGLSRLLRVAAVMAVIAAGAAAFGFYLRSGIPERAALTTVDGTVKAVQKVTTQHKFGMTKGPALVDYKFDVTTPDGQKSLSVSSDHMAEQQAAALIGEKVKFGTDGGSAIYTLESAGKQLVGYDKVHQKAMENGIMAWFAAGLAGILALLFGIPGLLRAFWKMRKRAA